MLRAAGVTQHEVTVVLLLVVVEGLPAYKIHRSRTSGNESPQYNGKHTLLPHLGQCLTIC